MAQQGNKPHFHGPHSSIHGAKIGEEEPGHLMASLLLSSPLQSALLQRQRKQKGEIANKGASCFWCRFSHCNKEEHEKQLEWFAIIINAGTRNTPFLCCQFEWLHVRLWSLQTFSSSSPWQVVIHLRNNIIQAIVSSSSTPRFSRFVSRMKAVNLCTGWQEIFQHLSYYVKCSINGAFNCKLIGIANETPVIYRSECFLQTGINAIHWPWTPSRISEPFWMLR